MYGENGGVLNNTAIAEMKEQMLLCVYFMQENLTERFPETDLYVYKLLRVVDPRLRKRPKLGKLTHGECVKGLLHIFEVPLHGFVGGGNFWRAKALSCATRAWMVFWPSALP